MMNQADTLMVHIAAEGARQRSTEAAGDTHQDRLHRGSTRHRLARDLRGEGLTPEGPNRGTTSSLMNATHRTTKEGQ